MECHIVARSKGGPRSGALSSREVDQYKNLILLCPTHHKLVDDQAKEYTAEALRTLKREHEEWVDETLEWRAKMPDSLWPELRAYGETLRLEHIDGEMPDQYRKVLDELGAFTFITADLLGADELLFAIRAKPGGLVLAFKFVMGRVYFAAEDDGQLDACLDGYVEAVAVEDKTDDVRRFRDRDPDGELSAEATFDLAASNLQDVLNWAGGEEATLQFRKAAPTDAPEFAFHVEGETVTGAAGPAETFEFPFSDFDESDNHDVTKNIKISLVEDEYSRRKEEGKDVAMEFFANLFSMSVLDALDLNGIHPKRIVREKDLLARLLRDSFFGSLLILRAADGDLEDPEIRSWAEENVDPRPPDGLRAVLPDAARTAVAEFVGQSATFGGDEGELEEDVLQLLYSAISQWWEHKHNSSNDEWLQQLFVDRIEWWDTPVARDEIYEIVDRAKARLDA
jgi:hypothetical protein